jgi:hypothetical protein
MEDAIANGILLAVAKLAMAYLVIVVAWGIGKYICDRPWLVWTLVGLVGAAVYVTYTGMWPFVWNHAYLALVVPMGLMLAAGILAYVWDRLRWTAKQWHTYPQWTPAKRQAFWWALAALVTASLSAGAYLTLDDPVGWAMDHPRWVLLAALGVGNLCWHALPEWARTHESETSQQRDDYDHAG